MGTRVESFHLVAGFLVLNETDCWKFRVRPALYTETDITMDLHFFPEPNWNDIVLYKGKL
jgi:hypothetical protein